MCKKRNVINLFTGYDLKPEAMTTTSIQASWLASDDSETDYSVAMSPTGTSYTTVTVQCDSNAPRCYAYFVDLASPSYSFTLQPTVVGGTPQVIIVSEDFPLTIKNKGIVLYKHNITHISDCVHFTVRKWSLRQNSLKILTGLIFVWSAFK